MNFEGLKNRVDRAETLAEGRVIQTTDRYRALRVSWREAWTPPRIMIAGFVMGFATGHLEPTKVVAKLGKFGGPKSLQMLSALSGLFTSIQATVAAATAGKAAETADEAAQSADDATSATSSSAKTDTRSAASAGAAAAMQATAGATRSQAHTRQTPVAPAAPQADAVPRSDRSRPDPVLAEQPRPAEASTELSESGR